MKGTLTEKILKKHLASGKLIPGQEIAIKIDQTLTQDATGTMAYLEFLNFNLPAIKTKLSVSYVDHNTLQTGFENADDHLFLQSVAEKYGLFFSRPGNGICHQVHTERFAKPGDTLIGSDSHTPTSGGVGMLAIGVGGLEIASALAGYPYSITCPEVTGIKLKGKLKPWSSAKDVILHILKMMTVKGGVNKVFEYFGEGVNSLSVPERATITNMGAELGATTSIFPSDTNTQKFLKAFGRAKDYKKLTADKNAQYKQLIEIDLGKIEPMVAMPHSPDAVKPAKEVKMKVNQVIIGSCTNSSYKDLMTAALAIKGKKVHKDVSLIVAPGSKTILNALIENGHLSFFVKAGARIIESACGPCIGMGCAPASGTASIRTFNRNFQGRSGTADASIILASAETAIAAAVFGEVTDPKKLGTYPKVNPLISFDVDDSLMLKPLPTAARKDIQVRMGPNIKPLPMGQPLSQFMSGKILIKTGDNVTTDDIMPAGAKVLPLRSNTPEISKHVFIKLDPGFYSRALASKGGFIIGGDNYGQGSSREHAALAPMHLGVKAVITKTFARIHKANLINFGLLPLNFTNPKDYDKIKPGDTLELYDVAESLKAGKNISAKVNSQFEVKLFTQLSERERDIILSGGKINYIKNGCKAPVIPPPAPRPVQQQNAQPPLPAKPSGYTAKQAFESGRPAQHQQQNQHHNQTSNTFHKPFQNRPNHRNNNQAYNTAQNQNKPVHTFVSSQPQKPAQTPAVQAPVQQPKPAEPVKIAAAPKVKKPVTKAKKTKK